MDIKSFVIGYQKGKASAPPPETQEKEITVTETVTSCVDTDTAEGWTEIDDPTLPDEEDSTESVEE